MTQELFNFYTPALGNSFARFGETLGISTALTNQSAANDIHIPAAVGLNGYGIVDSPIFELAYTSRAGKAEATIQAHLISGKWVGGYSFALRTKTGQGETLPPSVYDQRFEDFHDAIADAARRLSASLQARHGTLANLAQSEAREVRLIDAWTLEQKAKAQAKRFENPAHLTGLKFIDLFSGVGGFRLALESLGASCALSCEIDPAARAAYASNFDVSQHPFPDDVTKLTANDVPDCDIVVGGFPCQAFSVAGKGQGFDDPRGRLFFEVARIVKAKRPKLVILENVPNFLRLGNGRYAREAA